MFKCIVGDVRRYYGEGVGFYFAFLEMLTWSLIGPSCLGLIHTYFPPTQFEAQIVFCMLYMIWAFGLMEVKLRFPIVQLSLVENVVNHRYPALCCSVGKGAATDCLSFGVRRASMVVVKENREPITEEL